MRAATIQEIKQEIAGLKPAAITDLCLRLTRFKKENKELLTYLLFEKQDEEGYVKSIKTEIDVLFETINLSQLYYAKKSLRKIVRIINKYVRYSSVKATEAELRLYFCACLFDSGIPFKRNTITSNLYASQLKKAAVIINGLHEDLQYEYTKEYTRLQSPR